MRFTAAPSGPLPDQYTCEQKRMRNDGTRTEQNLMKSVEEQNATTETEAVRLRPL